MSRLQPPHRLAGVDTLRGLAIFFVLMNHVNMRLVIDKIPYGAALPRQLLGAFVWNGQRGVQIFFAVSGFLITSTSLRRWGTLDRISLRDFYRLRFARIAPLLLALLAILSVLHFTGSPWFVVKARDGGLGRALLAALTFHVNLLEANRGYLPPNWDILWSLSVEETFYLAFPLLCVLLGRGRWLTGVLIAFVAMGPLARTVWTHGNPVWEEISYLGGMDAIAMGCLTAIFLSRRRLSRRTLRAAQIAGAAMLTFMLGFYLFAYRHGLEPTGLDMTIVGFGTCLLIAWSAQNHRVVECEKGTDNLFRQTTVAVDEMSAPAKNVSVPLFTRLSAIAATPFRWLGQRSYEIYLTHVFVVIGIFVLIQHGPGFTPSAILAFFIVAVLLSGLAGAAVSRFYSEPMNRYLRRRWFTRGTERLQTAAVVADGA